MIRLRLSWPAVVLTIFGVILRTRSGLQTRGWSFKPNPKPWFRKGSPSAFWRPQPSWTRINKSVTVWSEQHRHRGSTEHAINDLVGLVKTHSFYTANTRYARTSLIATSFPAVIDLAAPIFSSMPCSIVVTRGIDTAHCPWFLVKHKGSEAGSIAS